MQKLFLFLMAILFGLPLSISAQSLYGSKAQQLVENAQEIHLNNRQQIDYIAFIPTQEIPLTSLNKWLIKEFKLDDNVQLIEINRLNDQLGETHIRYHLSINQVPIHDAMIIVHSKNGKVFSINGIIQKEAMGNYLAHINEATALSYALNYVHAKTYKWEVASEEKFIKKQSKDPKASYFPKAEMEIIKNKKSQHYRLAYKFNIYAQKPLSRADIYVDADNGDILYVNNLIHHNDSLGVAYTKYSGVRALTSDYHNTNFRLRETGRGQGIETYDMNNSTTYGSAIDFLDSNNIWNNVNAQQDEIATDAHWGLEMTYDYYLDKHNRNSIDGNGFKLQAYVHFDNNFANAYWNGQVMTFGDGNSSMGPLVALDIVGHEITHGLTSNTANLDYQDESGAMNEGFSDIFGTSIEFFAKPNSANWTMGEDIGIIIRSMSNPNSKGDPDTYHGTYYYTGTNDNGGVHTNSTVLSHCYYLMAVGGNGTNDNNDSYTVNPIGIDSASNIAFRALTVYLVNTSQYADARFYFIKAAADLYGDCSYAVQTTTNAFYAVGIGNAYIPGIQADFSADITNYCSPPAQINFNNLSNNASSFSWDFGDGTTSNLTNPIHNYTNYGNYTVKLVADGGTCGIDSIKKESYISIDTANPCIVYMPSSGTQTLNDCQGVLFDTGGPNNYGNNINSTTTIAPTGASKITLHFSLFDFESNYDYLKIYDGNNTSAPLIGIYDGNTLPNGGTIIANSGAVTLVQTSDVAVTKAGFVTTWQCTYTNSSPISDFSVDDTNSCSGTIQFNDISQNGPSSWLWQFGDGTNDTIQNPSHHYTQAGYYTVSLRTSNNFGNDIVTKTNYIHIDIPFSPSTTDGAICTGGSVVLKANASDTINWYSSISSNTILNTGARYTTPNLSQSTSYWVDNEKVGSTFTGGKNANNTNGSILNYEQSLIFNVHKNVILKSVVVYANSSGSRTIKLQTETGTVLVSKVVSVSPGYNTINLNFNLPIANNLKLTGQNLFRNNAGVSYPYQIPGVLDIIKSSASSNSGRYYYYFYDWKVQNPSCKSSRKEVIAHINTTTPTADFNINNNDPVVTFSDNTTNPGHCYWDFGDQMISQTSNPIHTYLQSGTYNVQLKVENGCGTDKITKSVTINSATGINPKSKQESIHLFPNPNKGLFTLKLGRANTYTHLSIIDAMGNMIISKNIQQGPDQMSFDLHEYSAGLYFIILNNSKTKINLRFIKQ